MTVDLPHSATIALPEVILFRVTKTILEWHLYNLCIYVQLIWELFLAVGCLR